MLEQNIKFVKDNIERVCKTKNIDANTIKIVAATKTIPVTVINTLKDFGIDTIGENRTAELLEKYDGIINKNIRFIGALQTNKVKQIIDKVTLIESLDRESLADEIDRQSKKINKITDVLIEINIGGEETKSGVKKDGINSLINYVKQKSNLRLCGFMSVLPINAESGLYKQMHEIFLENKAKDNNIKILSMGMSGDYLKAIENGSNTVRLGEALFGKRTSEKMDG